MTNIVAQELTIANKAIRTLDGLFSLNDLHKASGNLKKHKPDNFLRLDATKEVITEINNENNQFSDMRNALKVQRGGKNPGTFVCKELVYAYAMWISAKFSLLVIRTFDKLTNKKPQPKLDDLSTVQSRKPLKDAVNLMVPKCSMSYSDCYKMVHQRFGIGNIDELSNEQVSQAVEYVHARIIEGELMPQQESGDNKHIGLAIMKKAIQVKIIQQQKLEEMKRHLTNAQQAYDEAMKCDGAVWDGLHESQPHLGFDKETKEKATKKANENFENWKLRNSFH